MTFVVVSYLPIATPKSSGVATITRRQAREMAHLSTIADIHRQIQASTPVQGLLHGLRQHVHFLLAGEFSALTVAYLAGAPALLQVFLHKLGQDRVAGDFPGALPAPAFFTPASI